MAKRPVSVQETAYWVAFYRALESERPDALFRDPYARTLAGPRGEQIVRQMAGGRDYAWPMIVRTALMDGIIMRLAPKLDVVLNLAAGLDARPYRLALPPALRWIEVDFPQTLDYKAGVLKDAVPKCVVERVPLDLGDAAARGELFTRVGREARNALVVSEGLLVYLSAEQVGALADDIAAQVSFNAWLADIAAPWVLRLMRRSWGKSLDAGGSPFKFGPEDASAFFAAHGWRIAEYGSLWVEGHRLKREPRFAGLYRWLFGRMYRAELTRRSGPMSGVVLFEKAKTGA